MKLLTLHTSICCLASIHPTAVVDLCGEHAIHLLYCSETVLLGSGRAVVSRLSLAI